MISLITLFVLPYLAFVFFAENVNPFVKPKLHPLREQWRFGRRMALAVLIGGSTVLALLSLTKLTLSIAIAAGLIISLVLGLCFSIGKIRYVLLG